MSICVLEWFRNVGVTHRDSWWNFRNCLLCFCVKIFITAFSCNELTLNGKSISRYILFIKSMSKPFLFHFPSCTDVFFIENVEIKTTIAGIFWSSRKWKFLVFLFIMTIFVMVRSYGLSFYKVNKNFSNMIYSLQYSDENLIGGNRQERKLTSRSIWHNVGCFCVSNLVFDVRICVIICDRKTLCLTSLKSCFSFGK